MSRLNSEKDMQNMLFEEGIITCTSLFNEDIVLLETEFEVDNYFIDILGIRYNESDEEYNLIAIELKNRQLQAHDLGQLLTYMAYLERYIYFFEDEFDLNFGEVKGILAGTDTNDKIKTLSSYKLLNGTVGFLKLEPYISETPVKYSGSNEYYNKENNSAVKILDKLKNYSSEFKLKIEPKE